MYDIVSNITVDWENKLKIKTITMHLKNEALHIITDKQRFI